MSKVAFIGDIHGYLPALELALEWCKKESVDSIVGLGDFVDGYDANDKCVQLVKENFTAYVRGNHDEDHDQRLPARNLPEFSTQAALGAAAGVGAPNSIDERRFWGRSRVGSGVGAGLRIRGSLGSDLH